MASPSVAATNISSIDTAGTSHTVNLPASISAGDLLVVIFGYVVIGQTVTWSANGFTAVPSAHIEGGTRSGLDIGYRWADGTEGATITVTTSGSTKSAHTSYRITGAVNPATQAPESQTGATGSGANADPPNCVPTGGSNDYLFIAAAFNIGEVSTFTAFPTNYTNGIQDNTGVTGPVTTNGVTGSAQRQLTAASDNPGTFTFGSSTEWSAQTVVIHPASTDTTVTPAVVVTTATVPTPTVLAAANVTPAVVPLVTTVPTPTVAAAAIVTPVVVAAVTTIPTPTIQAGAAVEPAVIPTVVTVPTPTVATGDTVATPAVVATTAIVPTPTVAAGAVVTPATVTTSTTVPNPTVAGEGIGNPATVAVVSTVPTPTIQAGAFVTPATVATTTTVPNPGIAAEATVTPATVATVVTVPTPTAQGSVLVTPAVVPTVISVPTPTVKAGALVTPAVIPLAVAVPTPTIQAGPIAITLPATATIRDADHEATIGNDDRVAVLSSSDRTGTIR